MEIITGRTGQPHVYAADDAEIYKLFLGDGDFVLQTGNKLALERVGSAVTVHIKDGSLIMQGRLAKIRNTDGYDELTLANCPTGWKRLDLIVAEYSSETITRQIEEEGEVISITDFIETVELKVVTGEPSQGIPQEPPLMKGSDRESQGNGNIDRGETHRMKLWSVGLDGINTYSTPTDYRVFIPNAAPIQTALDYATANVARIQAMMDTLTGQVAQYSEEVLDDVADFKSDVNADLLDFKGDVEDFETELNTSIYAYADTLRDGISQGFRGRWRAVANVTDSSSAIAVTMPLDYEYALGDVFEVYLEGLRLVNSEYSITGADNIVNVTLNSGTFKGQLEVVIYRIAIEEP